MYTVGMTDASPRLNPISAIVLGLLADHGPSTSYDLKRHVDDTVGHFWSFPHSQLYAEPRRLAELGLLTEQQEEGGRRRRLYHLTDAGHAALRGWLATPAGEGELRDPGLLRLFFAAHGTPEQRRALAAEQGNLHAARLAEYQRAWASIGTTLRQHPSTYPLRMGLLYEEASLRFWQEVEALTDPQP